MNQELEHLTIEETAKYLRIPIQTIEELGFRRQLPLVEVDGEIRISKEGLNKDLLGSHAERGRPVALAIIHDAILGPSVKNMLKLVGFGRILVGTSAEGLAYFELQSFDLVFIEFFSATNPSAELISKLKALNNKCRIVGIVESANQSLPNSQSNDLSAVLQRPIEINQLKSCVQNLGYKGEPD
ncbi:MAG: hypothetical protein AAF585_10695 [Verrucomicrobiota bacterium]